MFESLIPQLRKKALPVLLEQVAAADKQQTEKTRKLLQEDVTYCNHKIQELQTYINDMKKYKEYVIKMNELSYNENIINELQEMNTKRQALLDQQAAEAFATHYKSYISTIDDLIKKNDHSAAVSNTLHILKLIKILNNPDESEVIKSKEAAVINMVSELFIKDCFQKPVHDSLIKVASPDQLKAVYKTCIDQFFVEISSLSFVKYLKFKDIYKCDIPCNVSLTHTSIQEYKHLVSTLSTLKTTPLDELLGPFVVHFKENELLYFKPTFAVDALVDVYTRGVALDVDLDIIKECCYACLVELQNELQTQIGALNEKYKSKSIIVSEHQMVTDATLLLRHSLFFQQPLVVVDAELPMPDGITAILDNATVLLYCLLLYPLTTAASISSGCERMLLLPDVIDQIGFEAKEMMPEETELFKCLECIPIHGDHTLQTTRTLVMLYQCHLFDKYSKEIKDEYFNDLEYASMMITNIGIPVLDILIAIKAKYPQYTGETKEVVLVEKKNNIWSAVLGYFDIKMQDVEEYFK